MHPELLGIAPAVRFPVTVQVTPGDVQDPELRDLEAGIERQLGVTVMDEACVRHLDQEQDVIGAGVRLHVVVIPVTQQGKEYSVTVMGWRRGTGTAGSSIGMATAVGIGTFSHSS
jgi:hypothetical protein